MSVALALLLCFGGWGALALAMPRHARQVLGHGTAPTRAFLLRLAGGCWLGLGGWLCLAIWGWRIGLVAWFGIAGAAALVLVFLLPYIQRRPL